MCLCHCALLRKLRHSGSVSQLMGVAPKRTCAQATDQQEDSGRIPDETLM